MVVDIYNEVRQTKRTNVDQLILIVGGDVNQVEEHPHGEEALQNPRDYCNHDRQDVDVSDSTNGIMVAPTYGVVVRNEEEQLWSQ